jgi:hypothetical protein
MNFRIFADSEYFEVDDIEVKQSGRNSLIAKEEALRLTRRLALEKMVKSISKSTNPPALASISDREIQNCIYEYSIDREKFSGSFYIGKISYRFFKNKVSSLLKSRGIHTEIQVVENRIARFAVYLKDFIRCANELNRLEVTVEKFSDTRIVFNINRKYVDNFRRLRIKYAQLM